MARASVEGAGLTLEHILRIVLRVDLLRGLELTVGRRVHVSRHERDPHVFALRQVLEAQDEGVPFLLVIRGARVVREVVLELGLTARSS